MSAEKEISGAGFNKCLRDLLRECSRHKFVDLPCDVGDTVYITDGVRIYANEIKNIIFEGDLISFDESAIGKSVFLTKEEAEEKMKEFGNE